MTTEPGASFKSVDQTTFFAAVDRLDLHPSIVDAPYDEARGYETAWKTRSGMVLGRSFGGTHVMPTQYMLEASR